MTSRSSGPHRGHEPSPRELSPAVVPAGSPPGRAGDDPSQRRAAGRGRRLDAQHLVVVLDRRPDAVPVGRGDPQRALRRRARRCAAGRTRPPRNSSGSPVDRAGPVERERVHPLAVQGAEEHRRRPARRSRRGRPPRRGSRPPGRLRAGCRSRRPRRARSSSSGPSERVVGGVRAALLAALAERRDVAVAAAEDRRGADRRGRRRRSAAPCRPATSGRRPAPGRRCRRCRRSSVPSAPNSRPPPLCASPRGMPVSTGFGRAAEREADHPVVGRGGQVGVEQPVLEVGGGEGQPEQAAVAGGVDARAPS